MGASGLDARLFSLFVAGGAGVLLIIVGTLALLLQRIVQQDGRTEVQLPFGVRLSTNYPALMLALLGAFLAGLPVYMTHQQAKSPSLSHIPIAGRVAADGGDARGDLFLGITDKIVPVGDIGQDDREVRLEAVMFPEAGSYMVLGIANWDDGKQDVGFAPITREGAENAPTFKMHIRRRR
ncbi:MAG: hypothetical protein ACRERE_39805 [Candidatus Entotheonellia bacterium]